MYNYEIKLRVPQSGVAVALTLIGLSLGGVILGSFRYDQLKVKSPSEAEAMEVDMDLTAQINAGTQASAAQVASHSVFNESNPDLVIFKLKETRSSAPQGLSGFFSRLAQGAVAQVSASQLKNSALKTVSSTPTNGTINYAAMIQKSTTETKPVVEAVNHNELKNIIASNQQVFQRCYEENLLKDDLLSGNASIVLSIGKSANVSFKGIGQEEIKNELRKCLSKKAVAMNFSDKYQGKSIKFSLFFNN